MFSIYCFQSICIMQYRRYFTILFYFQELDNRSLVDAL